MLYRGNYSIYWPFSIFPHVTRGVISTFSWRGNFFYFSISPDYWKIGKNSILYVTIWRYSYSSLISFFLFSSFFSFFLFSSCFLFFFPSSPPPPPKMTPLIVTKKQAPCVETLLHHMFKIKMHWLMIGMVWNQPEFGVLCVDDRKCINNSNSGCNVCIV